MNLYNETARPAGFSDAMEAPSTPLDNRKNAKTRLEFGPTDFVIYPAHGVGQILAIEAQTVAETSMECFVIFFTKSKLTVRVPVQKAASIGLRKPSDISTVQGAKQILSETPRRGRGNWSRLAQEYEAKINSGNIFAVAEVARDLFRLVNPGKVSANGSCTWRRSTASAVRLRWLTASPRNMLSRRLKVC